ncbi:MAG: molybdenum cofactor biosynthesis protein MoaE [Sulfolobales archaeon]|nr:molybdenum cofactor biosynthesis protein MoaE [Sulfolobales archaeon]MCX8208856.1 molybdenum cofactor biosynthesis protein MoaE [Sulfolobales archaeon]MDW8010517.1 molybdenum cofactor biosynthesis protein MoaE [Sulfolobales archaeon]
MRVRIRYYALLRELVGVDSEDIDVDTCFTRVGDIIEVVARAHPELAEAISKKLVLVIHSENLIKDLNQSIDLCSDSRVDLVPPSAGGSGPYEIQLLRCRVVDVDSFLRDLFSKLDPEAGAIAIYFGVVKGSVEGRKVEELRYEFHEEYTERALARIAEEVSRNGDVRYVKLHHSVGTFKPGDTVFAAGVVSRGRKSAIKALQDLVERVKHEVSVWKVERREDGTFWVVGNGERVPARVSKSR